MEPETPFVPEALLRHLEERFSDRALRPNELTMEKALVRAGEQGVLDHLRGLFAEQNERPLNVSTR